MPASSCAPWSIHFLRTSICAAVSFLPGFRRRHQLLGIGARNTLKKFALAALSRGDYRVFRAECSLLDVESQISLARFRVGPVAGETVLREDGQDLAPEVNGLFGPRHSGRGRKAGEEMKDPQPCAPAAAAAHSDEGSWAFRQTFGFEARSWESCQGRDRLPLSPPRPCGFNAKFGIDPGVDPRK